MKKHRNETAQKVGLGKTREKYMYVLGFITRMQDKIFI
jgi:hypothetical protein